MEVIHVPVCELTYMGYKKDWTVPGVQMLLFTAVEFTILFTYPFQRPLHINFTTVYLNYNEISGYQL